MGVIDVNFRIFGGVLDRFGNFLKLSNFGGYLRRIRPLD